MKKVSKARKGFKMLVAAALAVCMCVATGCSGSQGKDAVAEDKGKTQLTIAVFEGGIGHQWLKDSAARFEEAFKDVSFEEGKKGVQVTILVSQGYRDGGGVSTVKTEEADVWFTEAFNYISHYRNDNLANITDIVTEKLTKYGEDRSIEDKISKDYLDYLNLGTDESPEYYAVPFFDSFYGLSYDMDLFAEKNLYFKSSGTAAGDGADTLGFVTSASDMKSAGVDGKLGTYDDGLPATYAQFLKLIEKMRKNDIIPFIYAGGNAMDYTLRLMAAFWAQAEGEENYKLNTYINGTATDLIKIGDNGKIVWNGNKPVLEKLAITSKNVYELQRQAGKYYVLELFEKILAEPGNYTDSNLLHTGAQANFLKGKEDDFQTYGMIIEGTWWENEAEEARKALATRYGDEHLKENRNFGFMPLPMPNADSIGRKNVLMNAAISMAFIRSTTDILDCAKAFLQFNTTDYELSDFTGSTGITRSLDYELTDEAKEKISTFGESAYNIKKDAYVDYGLTDDPFFQNNLSSFTIAAWSFKSRVGGSQYNNPWLFWLNYSGRYSAEQYFTGMYDIQKLSWQNK